MGGEVLKVSLVQLENNFRREHDNSSALLNRHLQNVSSDVECLPAGHQFHEAAAIWKMSSHGCDDGVLEVASKDREV